MPTAARSLMSVTGTSRAASRMVTRVTRGQSKKVAAIDANLSTLAKHHRAWASTHSRSTFSPSCADICSMRPGPGERPSRCPPGLDLLGAPSAARSRRARRVALARVRLHHRGVLGGRRRRVIPQARPDSRLMAAQTSPRVSRISLISKHIGSYAIRRPRGLGPARLRPSFSSRLPPRLSRSDSLRRRHQDPHFRHSRTCVRCQLTRMSSRTSLANVQSAACA